QRFNSLGYNDLARTHRERYTPDRCCVVISGDFQPDVARQLVSSLTSDCLSICSPEPLVAIDPPQLGLRRARETFAIPVSRISLAWKSPALDHPDSPAFDVLAAILGRGRSSRLHRSLRDQLGLALEISAFSWSGPGREGLFGISADALPAQRDQLIEAIHREIAGVHADRLESDLAKAQRQIAVSQFRGLTTASGRAADLASNWHEARDLDFTRHHLAAIQAVTQDDVRRVARQLSDERLTLTVLDPLDAPPPVRLGKTSHRREDVEVHTLPNGLRVALIPDHRVPLVHLQAVVRAGLPSETAATNGLNQLLAATLPKGSHSRDAQQIANTLESLGASVSAGSGNNALLVQAAGLASDLATIVDVFAEIVVAPSFPEDAMMREKASQLAALEEAMQDPLHVGFRALRAGAFMGAGYGLDALGTPESLLALDRSALVAHHSRHFNTANITLAIAGDFDPAAALDLITTHFSALPSAKPWCVPAGVCGNGEFTLLLPKKQAVLAIGFPGVSIHSPERHALAMIQEYASDMAGPLFSRIREELGLAYQIGATQFLGYDTGLFTFYLATSPDQAQLARAELVIEIHKIATGGIPDDAFERVRSTVLSGLAIQQQSPSLIARQVALDLLFDHPADSFRHLAAHYLALTPQRVRDAAARVFAAVPTIATVLPDPSIGSPS
ncbi:MAG: hypothetical protein RLZZ282_1436, partial [Verrucomicrobiota bacterium]